MSIISLNNNISSLQAQRQLGSASRSLKQNFERLSSGKRIEKASDDAAGLSIASALQVDARVYSQGIKNISDGISLLNITEGAVGQLSDILIRMRELSFQAANGTIQYSQRKAINAEAQALRGEYNRISESTSFNGLSLLSGAVTNIDIQAGYGSNGTINLELGNDIPVRGIGDGSFYAPNSTAITNGTQGEYIVTDDFNNDGNLDYALSMTNGGLNIFIGNGDGSFLLARTYAASPGRYLRALKSIDLNRDGISDIAAVSQGPDFQVFLGNSDGSFRLVTTFATAGAGVDIETGDFNGDGLEDIIIPDFANGRVNLSLGNGNGTFRSETSFANSLPFSGSFLVKDFDNDGKSDIAVAGPNIRIHFGNGNGTFRISSTYVTTASSGGATLEYGDINNDGVSDIITSSAGKVNILRGNGDGTFMAPFTINIGGVNLNNATLQDINDDGTLDLFVQDNNTGGTRSMFGNGDGTFTAGISSRLLSSSTAFAMGDFNNDGLLDAVSASNTSAYVALGNGQSRWGLRSFSLLGQQQALDATDFLLEAQRSLATAVGDVGAFKSRLSSSDSILRQLREGLESAASQIIDVDIAAESSAIIRNKILQQSATAILTQANQIPELTLTLLNA